MSLQRYYANKPTVQGDGATLWHNSYYISGPFLVKVSGARVPSLVGEPAVTAYVTGESDTWFSQPCKFHYLGKVLNGYLTGDADGNIIVQHCYY